MRQSHRNLIGTTAAIALGFTGLAQAQVGEPIGTFGIRITHGSTVVVDNPLVSIPSDIKLSDGTPESFVQIGSIGPMNSPIILKMVTDDDPNFRISHWYVDVPVSTFAIDLPGPTSLFDPNNSASIDVEISNLNFSNTLEVTPLVVGNDTYSTAFMRDQGGVFYNMPGGTTLNFPGPGTQVQVPGREFLDGVGLYSFEGSFADTSASWAWRNLPNPGAATTTNNGINPDAPSFGSGYVFELGLGVSFVGRPVPEPGTLGLLATGILPLVRRRRHNA